jgi:hypothetical protein
VVHGHLFLCQGLHPFRVGVQLRSSILDEPAVVTLMLGACGGVSSHVDSKGTPPSSVLFVGSEDWTTFLSLVE